MHDLLTWTITILLLGMRKTDSGDSIPEEERIGDDYVLSTQSEYACTSIHVYCICMHVLVYMCTSIHVYCICMHIHVY